MTPPSPARFRASTAALSLLGLGLVLLTWFSTPLGGGRVDTVTEEVLRLGVLYGSALMCIVRGFTRREERSIWILLGLALISWASGEVYFQILTATKGEVPLPSPADLGYLLVYPLAYAALIRLGRLRSPNIQDGGWLDGIAGLLAGAAVCATLLQGPISDAVPDSVQGLVTLIYPVCDILLIGLLAFIGAMSGWRFERSLAIIAVALITFWAGDVFYLIALSNDTFVPGGLSDLLWPLAAVMIAVAAWQKPGKLVPREHKDRIIAPLACSGVVASLLLYGNVAHINLFALALAVVCEGIVLWRMVMVFREANSIAEQMTVISETCPLTGLGNRRALMSDLELAVEDEHIFLIFDLNGFKSFNDTFGHPAGDALLILLGKQLEDEAKANGGKAYRLGGDEYCVLLPGVHDAEARAAACTRALSTKGDGYEIGSAYGMALLPEHAATAEEAMGRADHLMYQNKNNSRPSLAGQLKAVLMSALAERSAELGEHNDDVANLAGAVARRMGLSTEAIDETVRAAELHDVGKVAIPDEILFKPGPLTDEEWGLMHTHTLIGERILAASSAMRPVGLIVRSSHEHWDGAGYPDNLAGEEIPLGARIVTTCDAFDAMTTDRPYRKGMTPEAAYTELRRCSGTQFDPQVVEALLAELTELAENEASPASFATKA